MSFLRDYTCTLIGAALFSGIMSVLGPDGSRGRVFRFIAGAVLLFCIAYPLKDIVSDIKGLKFGFDLTEKYDASYAGDYTAKIMENELKSNINACIKEITGEGARTIDLTVTYENDDYSINSITITVSDALKHRTAAIKSIVNHRFGVMPEVITQGESEYNG